MNYNSNSKTTTFFVGNVIWETIHLAHMYWVTKRSLAFPVGGPFITKGIYTLSRTLINLHSHRWPRIRAPGSKGYILWI